MFPDKKGYFGDFGGRFVPETLCCALDEFLWILFPIKVIRYPEAGSKTSEINVNS